MASFIALQAVPNQTLATPLGNQNCQLNVFQKGEFVYMDVFVNAAPIVLGVICENKNRIVRDRYLGFLGDFAFIDMQGDTDPVYTGLGDRYQLIYLEEAELPENAI